MPILLDQQMMREIIMDHYESPENRRQPERDMLSAHMDSASCIDDITVGVRLDEQGQVADCCWEGTCCVISTAATSIATELVKGKSLDQIEALYGDYCAMLQGREYDPAPLGEAVAFANTGRQPSRIGCATIGFRGILSCLKKGE